MTSLSFLGDETSYLRIPNDSNDLRFGTGDFTIEFKYYRTDNNPYTRIFQMGTFAEEIISTGFSIENGDMIYWIDNSDNIVTGLNASIDKNVWVHIAICRSGTLTTIYVNGQNLREIIDTTDYNSSADLVIGNQTNPSIIAAFGGYISYFSWTKGVALYTSDFTVPTGYPAITDNTVLLLTAKNSVPTFEGSLGSTVINYNVSVYNPAPRMRRSLFSNNALVFYKPGSLAACGVGSARNSRIKARRI